MSTFGERLRTERERLGYTRSAFGEAGGVSGSSQTNYEADLRKPDTDYLIAVHSIGADVFFLITGQRLTATLLPDEQELLKRYNASLPVLRQAARSMLVPATSVPGQAEVAPQPKKKKTATMIFQGEVGQQVHGNVTYKDAVTMNVGSRRKKKED
jgi:transcriptional regulator with XRE-family HTH domain